MSIDIMFSKQIVFLVAVLSSSGLVIMCASIRDRSTPTITKTTNAFLAAGKSCGFEVTELRSDSDGAVFKMRNDLRCEHLWTRKARAYR